MKPLTKSKPSLTYKQSFIAVFRTAKRIRQEMRGIMDIKVFTSKVAMFSKWRLAHLLISATTVFLIGCETFVLQAQITRAA